MVSRAIGDSEADVSLCASRSGPYDSACQMALETAGQNAHTVAHKNRWQYPQKFGESQSVDKFWGKCWPSSYTLGTEDLGHQVIL